MMPPLDETVAAPAGATAVARSANVAAQDTAARVTTDMWNLRDLDQS
jgi:hypothetical protein